MDGDSKRQEKTIPRNHGAYVSNVFQSTWLRRIIQSGAGLDRFLLDYGFNFLPYISILIWIILFITKMQ